MKTAAAVPALSGRASNLTKPDDQCLEKTLELAERMLRLADEGDAVRQDPGCGVLYGVLRDSAYKLQRLAEAEQRAHQGKRAAVQTDRRMQPEGEPQPAR
jgi:hypothetical protein